LPNRLLRALGASALGRKGPVVEILQRSPGWYPVLARPMPDSSVLTVGIGPRSRLIPSFRIARLLRNEPSTPPPYEVTLSEAPDDPAEVSGLVWRREGAI